MASKTVHTPIIAAKAAERARCMYRVVLGNWAADLLALRRRGLDGPVHRSGDAHLTLAHWGRGEPARRAA